jgi:alpha-tubulin suppressor-like RCC1 family protein
VDCWGDGSFGQFGYVPTAGYVNTPADAPAFPVAKGVAVGGSFVCVKRADDTIACAGKNNAGQLGDGTDKDRSTADTVKGIGPVDQLRSGLGHGCALVAGTVKCWGGNGSGQLGDGTFKDRFEPVSVAW